MSILSFLLGCLLLATAWGQGCVPPATVTNSEQLSSIFDQAVSTIQYHNSLFDYLSDPSFSNLKAYLLTQGRYFIPLWAAGGLTLLCFIFCSIQLCCFNGCKKR
jgi:hypothetical protein